MTFLKRRRLVLGFVLCAVVAVIANAYPGKSSFAWEGLTGSQDVRGLDRRISSLEQRLFSIEASISRLEQSAISQRAPSLQSSARDPEINLLLREVQTLQVRVNEIECGLVKLDERTTTPAIREARSTSAKIADPCRINPQAPLRLSTRP